MVVWYQASDGRTAFFTQPEDRTTLFMNAVHEAVNVHVYPYFPHKVSERHVLADDEPLKPGVQAALKGNYDEAMTLWKAVSDKNSQAHGALYNQGLVLMVRGDDEGALALFTQAHGIKDKFLSEGMMDSVKSRLSMRKNIGPGGQITAAVTPSTGRRLSCRAPGN